MAAKRRKKGDWVTVVRSRASKQRWPRETAACPWHCGRLIKTGGAALSVHLTTCGGR